MEKKRKGKQEERLYQLREEQWERLEKYFPRAKGRKGFAQKVGSREVLEAVLYRARVGCPWRDLPRAYGPWHTIYMRWSRWVEAGVLERAMVAVEQEEWQRGELDLRLVFLDSSVVRAHQHAAGAQKKEGSPGPGPITGRLFQQTPSALCQ